MCKNHSLDKIPRQPRHAPHSQPVALFHGSMETLQPSITFIPWSVKCTLYKVCGYRLIFTATRSKSCTTITNMIFVPRSITSFPEWTGTRQSAGRITAKIHHLEQVRTVLKWYFWDVEICQESTVAPLVYRLTELCKQWIALFTLEAVFVPIGYRGFQNFHTYAL